MRRLVRYTYHPCDLVLVTDIEFWYPLVVKPVRQTHNGASDRAANQENEKQYDS